MRTSPLAVLSLGLLASWLPACGADGGSELPAGLPRDKAEAAQQAQQGKTDFSLDPCDWWGWYGDGECDSFCGHHDPDCDPPRPASLTLKDRYTLPGDRLFPESLAYDAKREAFFVSSLSQGNITRVAADGRTEVFFAGTGETQRVTLGLKIDAPRDRLLACSYLDVKPVTGRVWIFDLATGQRTHDVDLTEAAPGGSCNDLVVDPEGNVFVTDREQPNIYRIHDLTADGGHAVELFATDPLLAKPRLGIGQNGIAITPDGRTLLTAQYLPPRLWRIDLSDPSQVSRVDLSGSHPLSEALSGADGMVFLGDRLYVAFGSSLLRLGSADGQWHASAYDRLDLGEKISAVTVAQGQLYVLKSDVAKFILGGNPQLPFEIIRVDPASFDR